MLAVCKHSIIVLLKYLLVIYSHTKWISTYCEVCSNYKCSSELSVTGYNTMFLRGVFYRNREHTKITVNL